MAKTERTHCCENTCAKDAEFGIYGSSGHFEDVTEACEEHVGVLLGTPTWLLESGKKENTHWAVYPLSSSAKVEIIVNSEKTVVPAGFITFEDVATLVLHGATPTVTYRGGVAVRPEGTLIPGEKIPVMEGMIFTAMRT